MFQKGVREEACRAIALFFYDKMLPFDVAKSEEFNTMFDLVLKYSPGFIPPSYPEITVKYLKK